MENAKFLRRQLSKFGFSDSAISAAWPDWWTDEADLSRSAQAELRFSLARKLGLHPSALLEEDAPRFVWEDVAKFKHLTAEDERELAAITSFGISVAQGLVRAVPGERIHDRYSSQDIRTAIIRGQPFVRLVDLLATCWGLGIPVVYLKVFPLSAKRMCAMSVKVDGRYAILIGRDAQYPAPIAYYVAHELGHIMLGHLDASSALVDFGDPLTADDNDDEELAADAYALELLTGNARPFVDAKVQHFSGRRLAETLLAAQEELQTEAGTLALCFGHTTGDWAKVGAAMKHIYDRPKPVWSEVNHIAAQSLNWGQVTDDFQAFLTAVMGGLRR